MSQIVTVHAILGANLVIPEYQRPYKWRKDSVLTLMNDIYSASQNNVPEYRLGTIVLHKVLRDDGTVAFNIVDGQQRLTTLAIMIFIFKELLGKDEYKHNCSENDNWCNLLNEKYNDLSYEAIVSSYEVLKRKIKGLDHEILKKYIYYLLNSCTFVRIVTESEQEAFQFFDSQNTRGKKLVPHDLLKSYHLREMKEESEQSKISVINEWENTDQDLLNNLFIYNLFPLVNWYKGKNGLNYSENEIKIFKGIQCNNNYNFSTYHKAANLFIDRYNRDEIYMSERYSPISQFQLTQPLIAGKRFFQYCQNYLAIYNRVLDLIERRFHNNEEQIIIINGKGDLYIYNMFVNVLIFFVDRFNFDSLNDSRLLFFFRWAYSLRLCMRTVFKETINNYARGLNDRLNENVNLFSILSEMNNPAELDEIVLESVKKDMVKVGDKYDSLKKILFNGDE